MRLTTTRGELKDAIIGFSKIINRKCALPVLGQVRIEVADGRVVARATDIDQVLDYHFEAAEAEGQGACLIPFMALKDLAKGGRKDTIEIEADTPDQITLVNHVGGHAVRHPVIGMELDEWPAVDTAIATSPAEGFTDSYRKLVAFSSTDETRYILNSVFTEVGTGCKPVTMVATDGRRLACFNSMDLPFDKSVILPKTKFLAWSKLPSSVEVGLRDDGGRTWLGVKAGAFTYAATCMDGTFPNFRQVIPSEPGTNVITFTEPDVALLQQVLPTLPGGEDLTVVGDDGQVTLYGRGPDDERWTTLTLEEATYRGERTFIGLNRFFLLDALNVGFREFAINDELSPLLSRDGKGGTHVLMPMRVEDPVAEAAVECVEVECEAKEVTCEPVDEPQSGPATKEIAERRTSMIKQDEQGAEVSALSRVLNACDAAKSKVKETGAALSELTAALREAAREQKGQAKEIEAARVTLAKLKAISI